jgi:16S rRNA (cytosine1402-N4)-methyltransferase
MSAARHVPVLLREVVAALAPQDGAVFVDGTFGAGGYSTALLEAADCTVWGIDRDPDVLAEAAGLVRRFAGRLKLIAGRFGDWCAAARRWPDLGRWRAPISARPRCRSTALSAASPSASMVCSTCMERHGPSAADPVNTLDDAALADPLHDYGEGGGPRGRPRHRRGLPGNRSPAPRSSPTSAAGAGHGPRRGDEIDPATQLPGPAHRGE